ncbi:hypothetical protein [Sphingomonas sp. 8AM]|uniref:hypothetical protein n=1 Tax=Sphingomonas sp. 8AM TaxID=2653170 RepID=UPI0012EFE62D|nr:hypothetical protein [Sphingomonas sp. 8AM]VXC90449.1 conserved membrane hypothetical protein [Sphingomonas sp. 8AM]
MTWRRARIAYCIAHGGKSLLWTASDLLTLYLLVTVYRVDPIVAGALFLAGLAANALADLAVGLWLGRHPSHAARVAGVGLALAALAFPATVLAAAYGPWALLAATLVFRIAYARCGVPHNALMTQLGDLPHRATWLARGRTIGTALASLLAALGASGSDRFATAPLLWAIAGAALLIGSAMMPLIAAYPPAQDGRGSTAGRGALHWLLWRFLLANVVGAVATGALAKAVLHLPMGIMAPANGTTILTLLILGRSASAFVPLCLSDSQRGFAILAAVYACSACIAALFLLQAGPAMLLLLGMVMGLGNLVGWALLPALADGPRGYGLYTMASKLALGAAGLALAGGLGRVPVFAPGAFPFFAAAVAIACLLAALLALPRLTAVRARAFPAP